jgi:UDP-2,3-diacylglucosamine pyrophosphatase LpxH
MFWTEEELELLQKFAKEGKSFAEIISYFPRHTAVALEHKYRRLKRENKREIPRVFKNQEKDEKETDDFTLQDELECLKKEKEELLEEIYKYRKIEDWANYIAQKIIRHITPFKAPPIPKYEHKATPKPQEMVALFSDCQIGQEVELGEMGEIEEYNFDIFTQRLHFWAKKVVRIADLHRKTFDIPVLDIFGLGDFVEGLDDKFAWRTADPYKQIVVASNEIAVAFRNLGANFERVRVIWKRGNHGMLSKNLKYTPANLDLILGHLVKEKLSQCSNIEFEIPDSFWSIVEIQGKKFFLIHGDEIRSWLGFPWYGQERLDARLAKVLKLKEKEYDYFVHGHWHNLLQLDAGAGERICNGSFVGSTPYGLSKGMANRPSQLVFGVHPDWGITWRYPIRLDKLEG